MKYAAALIAVIGLGCGADDLFISGDLGMNEDCEYEADAELAVMGEYDISQGADGGSKSCGRPYIGHLLVRNDNDEEVVVESALVRLMSVQHQTVIFDLLDTPLPNPFEVAVGGPVAASSSGVIEVEVIPEDYGRELVNFVDGQILAEIRLQGETADGSSLGSNRFTFPIAVCEGCQTFCEGDPLPAGACAEDPAICIDDGCGPI